VRAVGDGLQPGLLLPKGARPEGRWRSQAASVLLCWTAALPLALDLQGGGRGLKIEMEGDLVAAAAGIRGLQGAKEEGAAALLVGLLGQGKGKGGCVWCVAAVACYLALRRPWGGGRSDAAKEDLLAASCGHGWLWLLGDAAGAGDGRGMILTMGEAVEEHPREREKHGRSREGAAAVGWDGGLRKRLG